MYKLRTIIVIWILSCCVSVGVTFLAMDAKIKRERSVFSAVEGRIIYLKNEIKGIKEERIDQIDNEETHNGIKLKMWVKANPNYGKRIAGKVIAFKFQDEQYPIAILKGGKEISVFWLVPMKKQRG